MGTILDDDKLVTVNVDKVLVPEGVTARFRVWLNAPSANTVSASYETWNDVAPEVWAQVTYDYESRVGFVTFLAGQTEKLVDVPTLEDSEEEANEKFHLILSNPVNATIGKNPGVGRIWDNDKIPTIRIGDDRVYEGLTAQFVVARWATSRLTPTTPAIG